MEPNGQSADELVKEVADALGRLPDPSTLKTLEEFMTAGVDLMNSLLTLGKVSVCLQRPSRRGYSKRNAPILGLMVRMVKLYEGFLDQIVKHRRELAEVFVRPLFEAHVKLLYLIRSGRASAISFIETTYKPEKEMLIHLNGLKKQRPLQPIETRMRQSILNHLKLAGMTQSALLARKQWDLDGRKMRSLLQVLNRDLAYAFGFGTSSHAIHGTWCDLWLHHLQKDKLGFHAEIRYGPADPRYIFPATFLLVEGLVDFLRYFHLDGRGILRDLLLLVHKYGTRFIEGWDRSVASNTQAT